MDCKSWIDLWNKCNTRHSEHSEKSRERVIKWILRLIDEPLNSCIINKKYLLYKEKLKKGREDKSPVPSFLEFSGKDLLS